MFSVQTTTSKSPTVIKQDIRRVLDRMQVQYRETRTGFDCIHMPSIDINSVMDQAPASMHRAHRKQGSSGSNETEATRKSLARKSSKLSFGKKSKEREKDREGKDKELPSRPSGGTILSMTPSSASSSFFHVSSHAQNTEAGRSDMLDPVPQSPDEAGPPRSPSPAASKVLPPIPRDYGHAAQTPFPTGEVDQTVFETIGQSSLAVRFEINIVKVNPMFCVSCNAHVANSCSGALASLPRDSIPTPDRRRLAIPYVGTASVDRAEVMTTVADALLLLLSFLLRVN